MRSGSAPQFLSRADQLDPTAVTARIPEPRAGFGLSVPAWPDTLIEPTDTEWARWFELWSSPQAAEWVGAGHQCMLATLVRLEVRCRQPLPSEDYLGQLDRLRCELGLVEGV